MGIIVCATGAGARSRNVQVAATEAARNAQKRLVFLHIVDLSQVGELESSLMVAARRELAWLGEATLRLAQDRAYRRGVQTEGVILYGDVGEELASYLRDHDVDLLMLGEANTPKIVQLAGRIEDELSIPVQFVPGQQA
jgi:nucleotide-binding universal stress UspA family protein